MRAGGARMSELPPSERKRAAARARGQVAVSPLACAAGALGGAVLASFYGWPGAKLLGLARRAFGGGDELGKVLHHAFSTSMAVVLPICLGAALGALAVGMLQTRGLFTLD